MADLDYCIIHILIFCTNIQIQTIIKCFMFYLFYPPFSLSLAPVYLFMKIQLIGYYQLVLLVNSTYFGIKQKN
jgi:hypothetical protein